MGKLNENDIIGLTVGECLTRKAQIIFGLTNPNQKMNIPFGAMRAYAPNDLKLSDCGARRGSCVVRRSEDIRASVKGGSDETHPDNK